MTSRYRSDRKIAVRVEEAVTSAVEENNNVNYTHEDATSATQVMQPGIKQENEPEKIKMKMRM